MSLQESAPFIISVRTDHDTVVLEIAGEFDMAEVEAFRTCVDGIAASCDGEVVVDLGGITFIDSSAISVLLNARRRLDNEGRELWLRRPSPAVARVFELAGLTSVFDYVDE
jgi:anti-anti-sigma factor